MENPKDILGVDPHGALARPFDPRDYPLHSRELGYAPTPFDWDKGFDVEEALEYKMPTKDQGPSGSCGGQTGAQMAQAVSIDLLGTNVEMSAKAIYSHIFAPGGGTWSTLVGDFVLKNGFFTEADVSSYENGKPPSEAFMRRNQDVSAADRENAKKTSFLIAYTFPVLNIDVMAAALRDHKNLLIGIRGSNNGTWRSSYPSPKQEGELWGHFMAGAKAEISKGDKGIWAKQSWGDDVAPKTDAFQFISEDHFAAGRIFDAMVFVKNPKPALERYTFDKNIVFGTTSTEVLMLQKILAYDGVFNVKPTGYYGSITAQSIKKFRMKYGVDGSTDPMGYVVGPRTRVQLNALYGK